MGLSFGVVLLYSAYLSSRPQRDRPSDDQPDPLAALLKMDASYPTSHGPHPYHVHAVPAGFSLTFVAGALSGLLGIGSGAVKVLAMDQAMHIPYRHSSGSGRVLRYRLCAAA
ncbi:MAG: sulfite exporter TauE/SafE family protein [Acidobacteria bacterium]|nr:sulfite exporter TauE/SafE family protein [Acidobacteriota bacterium]